MSPEVARTLQTMAVRRMNKQDRSTRPAPTLAASTEPQRSEHPKYILVLGGVNVIQVRVAGTVKAHSLHRGQPARRLRRLLQRNADAVEQVRPIEGEPCLLLLGDADIHNCFPVAVLQHQTCDFRRRVRHLQRIQRERTSPRGNVQCVPRTQHCPHATYTHSLAPQN